MTAEKPVSGTQRYVKWTSKNMLMNMSAGIPILGAQRYLHDAKAILGTQQYLDDGKAALGTQRYLYDTW